ncbi:tautomerase family protein [Actinoplanes sp. NPDC051513]|uniref:tautomerase family protein n=1 Tax=Actinoplanes sp. NPDC051513 TaxID=3363908 RepID=UPI00379D038C
MTGDIVPLIHVHLDREVFEKLHEEIGNAIHDAQIEALGIPADDRFQIFQPHGPGELKFDPGYNDVDRRNLLVIRVIAVHMYPVNTKRAFFEAVVGRLEPLGIRPQDVLISLTENGFEDWYAGK